MGKTTTNEIRIYVANLGAYNAGCLIGEWLELPMDADELSERLANIVAAVDEDGDVYGEEWAIHDYEAPWTINEYDSVTAVNDLAERFDALDETDANVIAAVLENWLDVNEALEKLENGEYTVYSGCRDMGEVAAEYIDSCGMLSDVPDTLARYFDYDSFGRDMEIEGTYLRFDGGYVEIHN